MERKRELFKRYLDEKRVMDLLSRIVVSFYELPEKPADPLQYIQDFLASTSEVDMNAIRAENEKLTKRIEELKAKLEELQPQPKPEENQ